MVGLELRLVSGFILTLGIFLVLGIYTYRNNKSQLQTSYKVAYSSEVLLSAEALLNALVDAETGQRGFVISGKAEYLKPYHTSRSSLDKTLRELRGLTSRNELQQEMIDYRLVPLIQQRLLIMERVIAGRNRGFDAARDSLLALGGINVMDSIRTVVSEIQQIERARLEEYRISAEREAVFFNYAYAATGGVIVFILSVIFSVIYQNLKKRKKAEDALRGASAEVQDLFDHAPCGYLSFDMDISIQNINQTMLKWTGYCQEEVVGKMTVEDLLASSGKHSFRDIFNEDFEKYKKNGYVNDAEFDVRRKDGTSLPVIMNTVPVSDTRGNFVKSRSAVFDNSARKKAERERDNFFNNSMDLLVVVSMEGTIISWNTAWKDLLGYSDDVLEGANIISFIHPDDTGRSQHALTDILGGGEKVISFENRFRTNSGAYCWLLWNAVPVMDKGEVYGFARDITERRRSEEKIRRLNGELEAFTYSVSHDLRSPLRAISGYAQILKEDYFHTFDDEAKRVTQIIINGASRMGKLIDDLLDFSRLGRKSLSLTKLNMHEIVDGVFRDLTTDQDNGRLQIKILALTPVHADMTMLRQVWVNLISNAIKYSSKKTVTEIEIGSFSDEDKVCYYIIDKGAGFDMKYSNKLFGVFQRLHKVNEFEGTGVGLALVKRIIERHGGSVWAEGKINEGATFFFGIPATPVPDTSQQ